MAVLFRPSVLLLIAGLLVACLLITGGDGFRLRDYEVDDDQRVAMAVAKTRIQRRSAAVTEVKQHKKRLRLGAEDDDDDDGDDGDEDEDEEQAAEKKYKFERVRRSYKSSPSEERKRDDRVRVEDKGKSKKAFRVLKPKVDDGDDDDHDDEDEDEDDDDDDDEEEEKSIFNLYGLFGSKKSKTEDRADKVEAKTKDDEDDNDDDDNEEDEGKDNEGMFGWLKDLRSKSSEQDKDDDDDHEDDDAKDNDQADDAEEDNKSSGFIGWLKDLADWDEDSDGDHRDEKSTKDEDREKENPLINLVSSLLSTDAEDTSEEIKVRRVGADAEDSSSEVKPTAPKKPKESKIVQLLNTSPLNALFPAGDLPAEDSIETDPKKVKKLQHTPSKVVKQRIEISPEDFESLLLRIPSFVPDYARLKNNECRRQGQIFQRQLRGKRLWALQMIDASAKVTSGLLRGNANQLGDYDLCTGIATKINVKADEQVRMRGKYCLAHIDVVAEDDDLKLPVHLLQGRGFIKSTLNDPDHFLPRFTTLNWGICLPAACSFEDAGSIVKNFVKPYNTTGIKLFLEIEEGNCHVRQNASWPKLFRDNWQLVASLGFYTFVLVIALVASLNDFGVIRIEPHPASKAGNGNSEGDASGDQPDPNLLHQILMSFSVKRTLRQLVGGEDETLVGKPTVGCLSGLRALATVVLFGALRLIPMGFQPFTNRNEFTESFNSPWSVLLRVLMLYADVYLVISGFLAAYHMIGEFQQKQKVAWFRRIVGRYLRLTLPLIPVLIFYSWIWEHLGNGPQWGDVVVKNANLCKFNFWNNILFTQNWYPIEEGCAPHTFQLAIEMQLSIIAPFLLIVLTKSPFYGAAAFVTLHGLSTAIRFVATTEDRLSPYIYHGIRLTQIYRTANLSFSETLHRATPYLAGFGLGYLLRETDLRKHDRGINWSGWIGMAIAIGWCFGFTLDIADKDFQYVMADAAQYAALAPLSWALAICWIIYYCSTHPDGLLNRFLSCRPMVFLSKISYSVSLIQFLVFFYFAGSIRGSEVFSLAGFLNRAEICLLLAGGTVLTLLYDLPIQNVKAILDRSGIFDRMEKRDTSSVGQEAQAESEKVVVENGSAAPGPEAGQSSSGDNKVDDDFVSPFDERKDEDDDFVRPVWKRKTATPEPERKPASPTKGFWDDEEESDAPKVVFKLPPVAKTPDPPIEEQEEEEEEQEEEEEEDEEEEGDDEIDEEQEVIKRPTQSKTSASPPPPKSEPEPETKPKTTTTTTAGGSFRFTTSRSYSPPPTTRRRQWRTWDLQDD
ncbi:uncharacterized protein LOC128746446 [Sabethes cyaneus]|uniref:uncharacterized protein LOC128746446 n=1 Tax=Sabethes cyaneus TaxID=53552 RepID=UPI00237D365B|nr:uncharacterized protein LOC128746446 [Sabethes cyaneus]